jgi:hypothetical protein
MSDVTEDAQNETSQGEAAQLTINDLVAMKSIIDIASQRGTFKPSEMVVVGQTYTKLMTFLESVKKQGETK